MSRYAKQAKSSWAECAICGFDFPQVEMTRHYKFGFLVDSECQDELAHLDYMDSLRLPDQERPYPTQQRVPDQGTVMTDGFFFSKSKLDEDSLRPGPIVGQGPE
jgi:hypothetical protein